MRGGYSLTSFYLIYQIIDRILLLIIERIFRFFWTIIATIIFLFSWRIIRSVAIRNFWRISILSFIRILINFWRLWRKNKPVSNDTETSYFFILKVSFFPVQYLRVNKLSKWPELMAWPVLMIIPAMRKITIPMKTKECLPWQKALNKK